MRGLFSCFSLIIVKKEWTSSETRKSIVSNFIYLSYKTNSGLAERMRRRYFHSYNFCTELPPGYNQLPGKLQRVSQKKRRDYKWVGEASEEWVTMCWAASNIISESLTLDTETGSHISDMNYPLSSSVVKSENISVTLIHWVLRSYQQQTTSSCTFNTLHLTVRETSFEFKYTKS